MKARLHHSDFDFYETLDVEAVSPDVARLREFSTIVNLGPGDLIRLVAGELTRPIQLRECFLVEVHLTLGCSQQLLEEKAQTWGMATDVQVTTGATLRVISSSHQWITDIIETDPDVECVIPLRVPRGLEERS